MRYREFGGHGFQVSEVGLGTWQLGGNEWGEVDEASALDTLRAAAQSGVNFFDTADVYGLGRSETLIGRFLAETPGEFYVATKLGRFPAPGWPDNFTEAAIRTHTDASLQRLGVERIDVTQLHCVPTEVLLRGELFEVLRALQREGKIRHWGVSVESAEQARLCLPQEGLASMQIIFNLFRQNPIEFFDEARERGVALIVRLPLASGLLSGRMTLATHFAPDDHRSNNREGQRFNIGETFAGLPYEHGVELADALKPWVPEGMTMAQMALRWVLDFDAVSVVIPGARSREQALANATASDVPPLGADLHRRIRELYEDRVAAHIRGPYSRAQALPS